MDDDFELEMERYLARTPAEQAAEDIKIEAKITNCMNERQAWLDSLPLGKRVGYLAGCWLSNIRDNRRRLADPRLWHCEAIDEIWRKGIRHAQIELLRLRVYRSTGSWPGSG